MDGGGEKGLERGRERKVVRRNWSKGLPWWNGKRVVCVEERVGTVEGYVGLLLYTDRESTRWLKEVDGGEREKERCMGYGEKR